MYFNYIYILGFCGAVIGLDYYKCGTLPYALESFAPIYDGQGSIFLFGGDKQGFTPIKTFHKFNTLDQTFEEFDGFTDLYAVREGATALDENGDMLYLVYRYVFRVDSETALATHDADLPDWFEKVGGVSVEDCVYLFGGTYGTVGTAMIEYNRTSKTTRQVAQAPDAKGLHGASAVYDGTLAYFFGGFRVEGPQKFTREIWKFDPTNFQLQLLNRTLPEGVPFNSRVGSAALVGDHAYIIHGDYHQWPTTPHHLQLIQFHTKTHEISTIEDYNYRVSLTPKLIYAKDQNRLYIIGVEPTPLNEKKFLDILCVDLPTVQGLNHTL